MASTSGRIINASIGPELKSKVYSAVEHHPETYRNVSDFVTKALLRELSAKDGVITSNNVIKESKPQYTATNTSHAHIILKQAELSEEAAKTSTLVGDHAAAKIHIENALKYYKELREIEINSKDSKVAEEEDDDFPVRIKHRVK